VNVKKLDTKYLKYACANFKLHGARDLGVSNDIFILSHKNQAIQVMNRFAVIDLGTNTCNLLIANILSDNSFETLYDRKLPVKLGRGGIHKDILLPEAIERGISALQNHAETIQKYGVSQVTVIGTSALRGATNRNEFVERVKNLLGWKIEIIDGELEAELIFKGVKLSLPDGIGKYLILDIGGGSIEFILADDDNIIWKKSFNIGIARALELLQISDPAISSEILAFEQWFDKHLQELWRICEQYQPQTLVGCSGAFDTFMDIHEKAIPNLKIRGVSEFSIADYRVIHNRLVHSDRQTRSKMKGMDQMRVEMIVIASVFTNFILKRLRVKKLMHTHNSLKEGVMERLISEKF
jgi:exopolyphosphatase/guanosine-5'-triphosphate,3'-diphosphate pyrophosphatase